MNDPFIKAVKTRLGDRIENLYNMDDLKASMTSIDIVLRVHETEKRYATAVEMVINNKKSTIQLNVETPLPESLQDVPRIDEVIYKCL